MPDGGIRDNKRSSAIRVVWAAGFAIARSDVVDSVVRAHARDEQPVSKPTNAASQHGRAAMKRSAWEDSK